MHAELQGRDTEPLSGEDQTAKTREAGGMPGVGDGEEKGPSTQAACAGITTQQRPASREARRRRSPGKDDERGR